jgi:hypothetical protein
LAHFFSGSATISNLTFAGIQQSIASDLELNLNTVLAMQSVGAAMGNMICINNIVAVASVLALQNQRRLHIETHHNCDGSLWRYRRIDGVNTRLSPYHKKLKLMTH